jgi:hypothetical protein
MSIQIYKDFTLIFGPPAGEFFYIIVSASEQTGIPRCKIYEDMLFNILDEMELRGSINQSFSTVVGEDLTIGKTFRTKQTFSKARPDMEKLVTNSGEWVSVPVLMFFPSQFLTPLGDPIRHVVTLDDLRYVGAVMGQSFKLDWVQTIGVNETRAA